MEAKKEEDNCLSDVDSISNDEILPQSASNTHPKHQNLAVKRSLQIASVSPTSHKVQFAVDGHHDFIDEDSVSNSGAIAHEQSEDLHDKVGGNEMYCKRFWEILTVARILESNRQPPYQILGVANPIYTLFVEIFGFKMVILCDDEVLK